MLSLQAELNVEMRILNKMFLCMPQIPYFTFKQMFIFIYTTFFPFLLQPI